MSIAFANIIVVNYQYLIYFLFQPLNVNKILEIQKYKLVILLMCYRCQLKCRQLVHICILRCQKIIQILRVFIQQYHMCNFWKLQNSYESSVIFQPKLCSFCMSFLKYFLKHLFDVWNFYRESLWENENLNIWEKVSVEQQIMANSLYSLFHVVLTFILILAMLGAQTLQVKINPFFGDTFLGYTWVDKFVKQNL
eukprot:TRINITY_DN4428_c0_g3_i1.p1 TRINITY_DN4428_c0_g3~~TRINITY_DN4428_c0_g3_i1.p1  ORF type:complete len:195 (+),score=-9.68 TRINITY_DN4428_c0_g3_i1:90-674(+)